MRNSIKFSTIYLYNKMNVQISKTFCLIFVLALHNVQAKAVRRKPKHLTFPGFEQSSHRYSPQIISITNQETGKIENGFKQYVPLIDGKPIYIENSEQNLGSTGYDDRLIDGKYDLTYHKNLDEVFQFPGSSNSNELSNKNPSSVEKIKDDFKKPPLRENDPNPLKDDQVFIHMKNQNQKHYQTIMEVTKSLDFRKPNFHSDDSNKCLNEKGVSCDSQSLLTNESSGKKQIGEGESHSELNLKSGTIVPISTVQNVIQFSNLSPEKNESISTVISIHDTDHDVIGNMLGDTETHTEANVQLDTSTNSGVHLKVNLNVDGTVDVSQNLSESTIETEETNLKSDPQFFQNENFDVHESEEDRILLKDEVKSMFETSFRSFIFNPEAESHQKFQECTTPKNESGTCRYIHHCLLPSVLSSIQHFIDNACIIEERFIGVCCPEFPVQTVLVNWLNVQNLNAGDTPVKVPEDCGVGINTRIVGGTNAGRRAWPWMVALLNDHNRFYCGGALINDRFVLTASHCTFGNSRNRIIARLGEFDFTDEGPHDDYQVTEIKRHGQFTRLTLRNDIALLKLEKPVVLNEFVKTICLPEPDKDYIGQTSTLAGWGHMDGVGATTSNVLQEASFPIIENVECAHTHNMPVPKSLICAAATEKNKGACNGDSGGPLMLLDDDERWKVIGLVSWGRRGCNPRFPTVYTRVSHYLDWIKKHSN